jgi:ABC-type polysaccharide/polyol phosphate transport system ATPase subunit
MDRVAKRYKVRRTAGANSQHRSLRQRLTGFARRRNEFWALRDVSFAVAEGETLGIIGHNGAGKSTILKLLSSVTVPTSGEIRIYGRLSALIEVGSGFHPELTGRENIYLSGSILGMRRREIADKLERIIEFAGVRDFIDAPVKHYSSGMYVRLGFSIAAHLEPDILLLDEVLAVGDAAFQSKCLDRITELHRQGRTIVFISHDLGAVERLCDRVILLKQGQVMTTGTAAEVIAAYQEVGSGYTPSEPHAVAHAILSREMQITSVTCHNVSGEPAAVFRTGSSARLRLTYVAHRPVPDAVFEIYLYSVVDRLSGVLCQITTASRDGLGISVEPGPGTVEFEVDEIGLQPGMYYVSATIAHTGQALGTAIDWQSECLTLRIDQGRFIRGTFYMPHRWLLTPGPASSTDAPDRVAESVGP